MNSTESLTYSRNIKSNMLIATFLCTLNTVQLSCERELNESIWNHLKLKLAWQVTWLTKNSTQGIFNWETKVLPISMCTSISTGTMPENYHTGLQFAVVNHTWSKCRGWRWGTKGPRGGSKCCGLRGPKYTCCSSTSKEGRTCLPSKWCCASKGLCPKQIARLIHSKGARGSAKGIWGCWWCPKWRAAWWCPKGWKTDDQNKTSVLYYIQTDSPGTTVEASTKRKILGEGD